MFDEVTLKLNADPLILSALKEDITSEDVSTNSVMPVPKKGEVNLICKQDGVICGLQIFERVFTLLDENTEVEFKAADGDKVKKGQLLAVVRGDIKVLLCGERTALNYLQRMSGIATYTNSIVKLLEGSRTTLLDTRKTTPNMRLFEKYAVKVGGATNHRYNLSDCAMLKDTHLDAYGSMTGAVNALREKMGHTVKIEVEVGNLEELKEALTLGVEIIMLDNMTNEDMAKAVEMTNGKALLEASGNVTSETIRAIAETGVDIISIGAITHSVKAFDISMKMEK